MYHDLQNPTNDPKIKGYFICFLVKPDLNLIETEFYNSDVGHNIPYGDSFRSYSHIDQNRKIFRGLINKHIRENLVHPETSKGSHGINYFSNIFSNQVESVSYPDVASNSEDTLTTMDKGIFKLPVTESGTSGLSFNVRLRENEAHDSLRFVSVWHKYIHAVTKGNLFPKLKYLKRSILDYKASLYTLHLKPDLKTITFYTKYTGVFPSNIPLSSMSESIEEITDLAVDVEFSYDKFEWMTEDIIRELNLLTSNNPITSQTLKSASAYTLQSGSDPMIKRIDKSPFFRIDLNGLDAALTPGSNKRIQDTPAGLFGAKMTMDGFGFFPAPLNENMINFSIDYNLYEDVGYKNKIVEQKFE